MGRPLLEVGQEALVEDGVAAAPGQQHRPGEGVEGVGHALERGPRRVVGAHGDVGDELGHRVAAGPAAVGRGPWLTRSGSVLATPAASAAGATATEYATFQPGERGRPRGDHVASLKTLSSALVEVTESDRSGKATPTSTSR